GTTLSVLDRGRGMDEPTMRQALLPFYSTKASGTGLGLAICTEIIDAHRGRISLRAREGGGVAVTCWLPG
ncbi:MAG: ATP-binding protein, partial [Thermoanaerobaculia bacterium]